MKEIRMQLSDQNYKIELNLIFFFFQVSLFLFIVLKLNKKNGKSFNEQSWLLVVRDRSMNPAITKMEYFAIIVNGV